MTNLKAPFLHALRATREPLADRIVAWALLKSDS